MKEDIFFFVKMLCLCCRRRRQCFDKFLLPTLPELKASKSQARASLNKRLAGGYIHLSGLMGLLWPG